MDELGGLDRLLVDVDLAAGARGRGEAARLEHPRRPQPLVDAQRIVLAAHAADDTIGAIMPIRAALSALLLLVAVAAWAADQVVIEDWKSSPVGSKGIPRGWEGQRWGSPAYEMVVEDVDGRRALHLFSRNEGSTVTKDIKGQVNLNETPILEWSWKAVTLPANADSRRKELDDQAVQ